MAFDYPGVDTDYYTDDDRDKLAAFGGYPPVAPAPAADAPAASPSPYPPVESASPAIGSTDDLEARAARPKTAMQDGMPPVESASPAATTPAVSRLSKMTAQGAPPVEPLHGWKRGLDALAQLTWPTQQLSSSIRFGPQRAYEKNLGAAEQDVAGETAAETTPAARAEAEGKPANQTADTREENARAAALETPPPKAGITPEETTIHDLMTGENGQPRMNPQTNKPYSYLEAFGAVKQAAQDTKAEKQPDDKEKDISDYLAANKLPDSPANRETARKAIADRGIKPDKPEKPQRVLGVTPDHKVIEITPGMTLPEGTQTVGGEIKSGAGNQAAQDALSYATDYLASGKYTGAGDEALMEKYFELAKPSSGFRMTQPQIEMLTKAQDVMNSVVAKGKHLFSPESPYFSTTLRQQIVETMTRIENTKGHGGGAEAGREPQRPANVPANYVHKANGPKGSGWYKP